MSVKRDKLRDVVLAPDFRREKLLHDRMVRVCRRGQRLAAQIAQGRDDLTVRLLELRILSGASPRPRVYGWQRTSPSLPGLRPLPNKAGVLGRH